MKRSFVILLGFGSLVLASLIIILNSFSSQQLSQDRDVSSGSVVPTTALISNRTNPNNNSVPSLVNDTSLLSTKDRSTLKTIQLSLPVEDSDIGIAYSPITEQFIVQKKTAKADELFNQFLENNQLTDLYAKHSAYFVVSNRDLHAEIIRIENEIISVIDDSDNALDLNSGTANETNSKSSALFNLVKAFSPVNIGHNIFQTNDRVSVLPDLGVESKITPSTQVSSQYSNTAKSNSNLDEAVKKSCYNFKMNKCGGVGSEITNELRPGVTNGTYPVDKALVEELFSNPNAVGLRNRRWQFDDGMVHPKLVRFLNEFVKSNTLDRHLGIAGGTDRCCARNSKTKTPAVGCRLTPHRLGVAIDLDTLNGSRVINSKVDDPGMRKAMDWINAQTGDLRPDSVTMSDIFTGLYPFHPDSAHRNHLHVDFSRSLNCK